MNCDEAFDRLTDPQRPDDPALRWHLDLCPRCRQMQEVLAPALGLFADVPEPPHANGESHGHASFESRPSESPRPLLTPESIRLAEQLANRLASDAPTESSSASSLAPSPRTRRAGDRSRLVKGALAAALLLWGGFLAHDLIPPAATPPAHRDGATAAATFGGPRRADDDCLWLAQRDDRANRRQDARSLALSCVACHLPGSLD